MPVLTVNDESQTVTVPYFARVAGIGRATAYNLIARGEIRHTRLGRRVVIPRTELDRVVQATADVIAVA